MKRSLVEALACPFCGDGFRLAEADPVGAEIVNGVLECGCDRFPLIAGIPVILKDLSDRVRSAVEKRQWSDALVLMVLSEQSDPFWLRVSRVVGRQPGFGVLGAAITKVLEKAWAHRFADLLEPCGAAPALLDLMVGLTGNREFGFYLHYKLGQPRHLVALAMGELLDPGTGPVLDLGCGPGQITGYLQVRAGGQPVIGCDRSFGLLTIAHRRVAPDTDFVCCDVESPLPFKDGQFGTLYSFDAFHHVRNKRRLAQELTRVGRADALCCLGSVRNALVEHDFRDEFITPDLFDRLAEGRPHRLVADANLLDRYLEGLGPDLAHSDSQNLLQTAELMTLVVSGDAGRLRTYGAFETWPHAVGRLGLNPLYVATGQTNDRVSLSLRFPSAHYEAENRACLRYMPATVDLSLHALGQLEARSVGYGADPEIDALARCFVALGTPAPSTAGGR
jgi:SAM-dependent methyltransferase/uncharacterized protein YbaR (Trm112 family)